MPRDRTYVRRFLNEPATTVGPTCSCPYPTPRVSAAVYAESNVRSSSPELRPLLTFEEPPASVSRHLLWGDTHEEDALIRNGRDSVIDARCIGHTPRR